ncbi:MAG: hypothetical protein ACRDQU_04845, partial [Pseudonocardiaceae bacterium]
MTVLILASEFDVSADQMILALRSREVPVCRVDTRWFPTQLSIDAQLGDGRWRGWLRARKITFTRLLSDDDLADLRGIDVTAHQFQRWAPKQYDARVIAIGDRLFAFAIHAGNTTSYIDFRADYDALSYQSIELPTAVSEGIRQFLGAMGLAYGAVDFVVSSEGAYTFLEFTDRSETCTWRSSWRVTEASRDRLPARFGTFVLFGCRDGVCS